MFDVDMQISRLAVGAVTDDISTSVPPNALELFDTDRYWSTYYEGFGRPKSTLNLNESPVGNYSEFESSSITDRTLEFDLYPQGDIARNIRLLNKNLPFGILRRFYICTSDHVPCFIDGVTEALPADVKAGNLRSSDVVIRCPFPWFTGLRQNKRTLKSRETTITNNGDISAGFSIYTNQEITVNQLSISCDDVFFKLTGNVSLSPNYPVFCSVDHKHDGFDSSGNSTIGLMQTGSEFFKLPTGNSKITINDELAGKCYIVWRDYYSYAVM